MTLRQQRFVLEYLKDLNAAAAYQRAGYTARGNSAESAASRLLRNVQVAAAVEEAQKRVAQKLEVTVEKILEEYARIGFSRITDIAKWGGRLIELLDSTLLGQDAIAAIAEVSEGREGIKVKLHDKKGALDSLARHLGMFKDQLEVTGKGGEPLVPIQTLQKILSRVEEAESAERAAGGH